MDDWKTTDKIVCPNNVRHGEMKWHPKGGLVCEHCKAEHKPRSKVNFRFANPR